MLQTEKKLMTIGEAAKSTGVTRRIILNYEDKGLLVPDKKEGRTGNRYYTIDSVSKILTIRSLQNMGLSLDEIHSYYTGETNLEPLIQRLEDLKKQLDSHIRKLKQRTKNLDFPVETITLPAQTAYSRTIYAETTPQRAEYLRETFVYALRNYQAITNTRLLFTEYSLAEPNVITNFVAVSPDTPDAEGIVHLQEEKALSVIYHGSYDSIPEISDKLVAYAKEHDIQLKGQCRRIFLEGPPQHTDPSKYITQVAVLIEKNL